MIQRLSNGLTAVLVENHSAPVVALQVWVKVGAADEQPDEAGLAHLHEHMLFKGTARRGTGEIARAVEGRGGEINAWTSHDQTVYHLVLGAPYFSDGLDILADAMRESSFNAEELARETQVVVEEIKRSEDSPQRQLSRELFRTAYATHPYRLPVIGTPESVLGFTRDKILGFYRKHYAPQNMVVVAVGDFEMQRGLGEVERLFGDWSVPQRPAEPETRLREAAQTDPRATILRGEFRETQIAIGFHIPEFLHQDVPALDLLAVLLGQGDSARLPTVLKRSERLFSEVYSYGYTPRDPGLWVAGGAPETGKEAAALRALLRELDRARQVSFAAEDLAKAKHLLESEEVYQRETVQGWARKVGFYETMAGSLEAEAEYQAKLQATTLADVQGVARRYLRAESAALVVLEAKDIAVPFFEAALLDSLREALPQLVPEPQTSAGRPATTRRSAAEPLSGLRSARSPLSVLKLSSGGTLLVQPDAQVPLIALRAAFLGGVRTETEATNGITSLLASTVTRGAGSRTSDAIAATIDEIAGSLSGAGGRNSFGLRGEFLSRHLDKGLALFADCLVAPQFPDPEVERERANQLQEIQSREDHPSGLAFELFAKTLFTVHPNRLPVSGEAESVARLDAGALRTEHARRYPLSNLTLAIVGDVRPAEVHGAIEQALAKSSGRPPPFGGTPSPLRLPSEPVPTTPRYAHRVLAKAQTHLVVGYLGVSFHDPSRHALELLSSVLSGQGGRLFLELRDKRSLAYSVTSMSVEGVDPGYFAVYMGTSPEKAKAALQGIREELARVRDERISDGELADAKQSLIGSHAIGLQRRASLAGVLALDELYGLGAEAYLHYAERIQAISAETVRDAARRILDPRGEVVVEVGPQPSAGQA